MAICREELINIVASRTEHSPYRVRRILDEADKVAAEYADPPPGSVPEEAPADEADKKPKGKRSATPAE